MSVTVDRSVEFTLTRAADGEAGDRLTLEGYAAVFDQRTEIDSWEGSFVETIRRGAFRKTIRERTPVMQFDHGRHPLVGSIPIGRIATLREDEQGLYVQARLSDNWLIEPVRDAISDEAVSGMSFRFEVVRDEWRDNKGKLVKTGELEELLWNPGDRGPLERTLIELKVHELGPVVFPAYDGTSVGVRAAETAATIMRDRELQRDMQRALAADIPAATEPQLQNDPDLRREVARAVLFNQTTSAAPLPDEQPDEDVEERDDAPDTSTTDAPPEIEAPVTPDAPPTTGHPSPTDRDSRLKYARLAYVTRNGVGKKCK